MINLNSEQQELLKQYHLAKGAWESGDDPNLAVSYAATLERPAKAQLDEEIMTSLGSESSPITLEQILAKLRSTSSSSRSVYMHELARSIWRLADEGKVIVESGLIRKLREARRPNRPPSLKEQALEALERMQALYPSRNDKATIVRALEALDD